MDEWKKTHRFKDPNLAARVHFKAGEALELIGKSGEAGCYYRQGLAYKPTEKQLANRLMVLDARVYRSLCTGFVITADGYVLTNDRGVREPGELLVRLSREVEPVPAEIIAQDEQGDMALLRIKAAQSVPLMPVRLNSTRQLYRGEPVAVLGYPLAFQFNASVSISTGVITGTPEAGNNNVLLVSARANPGNNGGPLCDQFGNVVGMVIAKRGAFGPQVESYGMARTAQDLQAFLSKNLKNYKPLAPAT